MARFAPLINLLYSIVGFGEAICRYAHGDYEGAGEAFRIGLASAICAVGPYSIYVLANLNNKRIVGEDSINGMSALMNAVLSITAYTTINIVSPEPPKSLTYAISPIIGTLQVGINSLEAYLANKS
jgi:hypothetical protein